MRVTSLHRIRRGAASEDGFTMLFALLALFVGALLVAAAFATANGDLKLSHKSTLRAKAYYAALAGVERYQYEMTANPNYWVKCPSLGNKKVPETTDEEYTVKTLGSAGHSSGCEKEVQTSILETTGAAKGTFRILSTGTAGGGSEKTTRAVVATFAHPGFTQYVYETNYEVEDPTNFSPEPTECAHYYSYRSTHGLTGTCPPIEFAPQDKVNGPMHTNDAAAVCAEGGSKPIFGRKGHEDKIEMNGGHYAAGGCSNSPEILGKYTESAGTLEPPETDTELLEAAEYKFKGRTEIELKTGSPNTMKVTTEGATTTKEFPAGGVVYVSNSTKGCAITKYSPFNADTENDTGCGNVYVHGTYTESLTIASAGDVIVNGNLTTTGGEAGGEATGGATLGLIAENFVRIYHPVKKGYSLQTKVPKSEVATSEENAAEVCGTGFVKRAGTLISEKGALRKEITGLSSTAGLSSGMSVEGEFIAPNTTITLNKGPTAVELSAYPEKTNEKEEVWFYKPLANGFEYAATLKKCVEPPEAGYTFHESELLDVKGSCESSSTYTSKGFCEYENDSSRCTSKATNLNASEDPNKWGALSNPIIDAAILSTKHSWIVDNYKCGAKLGELTVWGSIAQYWRGPVGTSGGTGYFKNYNYDQRLSTQQPPNFLSPTSTTWRLSRETEPPPGFTG